MKKIALFFLIVAATSCDSDEGFMGTKNTTNIQSFKKNYQVIELEDCEYILFDRANGNQGFGYFAHKGNCNNPIHCYNK